VTGARPLGLLELALAVLLAFVMVMVSWRERLGLERRLTVGITRALAQLLAMGFLLAWVFQARTWYYSLLFLAAMTAVAVQTGTSRQHGQITRLWLVMTMAIGGASVVVLLFVLAFVVRPPSLFDPQYVVPLGGMVLGASLNGASLAVDRLLAEVGSHRARIEAALALGATATQAARFALQNSIRAALVPTMNALAVVGLVQLPGMMTGQILAGGEPTQAVRYQIVAIFMSATSAVLTASLAARLALRQMFTRAHQLRG
jgi:putative ABC transport system permease protein